MPNVYAQNKGGFLHRPKFYKKSKGLPQKHVQSLFPAYETFKAYETFTFIFFKLKVTNLYFTCNYLHFTCLIKAKCLCLHQILSLCYLGILLVLPLSFCYLCATCEKHRDHQRAFGQRPTALVIFQIVHKILKSDGSRSLLVFLMHLFFLMTSKRPS